MMNSMNQAAYKFAAQVGADGKLEVTVPVPAGTPVEVVVLTPLTDEFTDPVQAAQTSLDFWDNPQDDADWKDKPPADIFAEMEPLTVSQPGAIDSREAIYQRLENE
jgi:hypothetical protein